jgi:O-antigen/teichoic acid export membrane protein
MASMSSPDQKSLKQRVLHAGGWSFAGYGLSQAIRFGSNLVMARLLVPEMFGIMAIATMVMVILNLLSDVGLHQNIVQSRRGDDPAFLDTVWVVQIARGVGLWFGLLLLSMALHLANLAGMLPAKSVYASPVLPLVIAVSSIAAVIAGFKSTKTAVADRNFNQKRLIQIELISQCTALTVMIVIGVISRSIWALVGGGLVASLTTTVLSHTWMSGHPNRFRLEKNALRELIGFGKWIFVSSFLSVLASQGDRLLLGGFVEADVLGLFAIASLIIRAVANGLNKLFVTVSLPALSETARSNPSRLRAVYYKLSVPSDLLLLFMTGLLFATGQLVIDLLYDYRYSEAGGLLRVLALSLFVVRYGVALHTYLAVGVPRYWTIINVVRFVALYALVPPLYYVGGTQAAIWGIALHELAIVPLVYYFNAKLGLIDLRREALVLLALPVGLLSGFALNVVRASLLSG